ncbi:hypothetical protein ACSQ67_001399 [Phaseolus vulgaris]
MASVPSLPSEEALGSASFRPKKSKHAYATELSFWRGIYILYKDVKSCPCEDVHVLWSILVESGAAPASLPSK